MALPRLEIVINRVVTINRQADGVVRARNCVDVEGVRALFCRRIKVVAAGLILLCLVLQQASVRAQPPVKDLALGKVEIQYGFYLSDVSLAELKLNINFNEISYSITVNGRTVGLVDLFAKIKFLGSSRGVISGGIIYPGLHSYRYSERDKTRDVKLIFNDRVPVVSATPEFKHAHDRVPLSQEDLLGTIDLASQFIAPAVPGAAPLASENCVREYSVSDGRLRVDVTISHLKNSSGARIRGVNYKGPFMHCAAKIRPIGGHKEGDMLSKISHKSEIDVWVAPVFEARFYIPILVRAQTPIGTAELRMHKIALTPSPHQGGLSK